MDKSTSKERPLFHWLDDLDDDEEGLRDELAKSYDTIRKLLPFMAKRGIPVNPKNYRIFFDYISFNNPEINKVVNELLEKDVKFGSQVSGNLYAFFYGGEAADLQANAIRAANAFISITDSMAESLRNAKDQNDHFHDVLASTSLQMTGLNRIEELQPHLEGLLAETEQTLSATNAFSDRLKEANNVISNLKEELKVQTSLANVDELTGLSNRHRLSQEGPRLLKAAQESRQPLSAIIFDIDWFKAVNDSWGHHQGDLVLKVCADIIKAAARSTDLAVRLGGEEFLLLCSNLALATAAKVATRVRQGIAATEIEVEGHAHLSDGRSHLSVTVSGGVAEYLPGEDLSSLIARADDALYRAKASGRNCVRTADSSFPLPILDDDEEL